METTEHETGQRRRREDRHPLFTFFAKFWIAMSTTASIAMALFLAIGFEFKTPASWIAATNEEITLLKSNQAALRSDVQETNRILGILAREACANFTSSQLRVTPDCDPYIAFPPTRRGR